MPREQHVIVYWDEHLKGHAFAYRKPDSNKVIISDGVYDRETDAENSAWLCCFARLILYKAVCLFADTI